MSAFLGPIHHWLFAKIRLQNELTDRIADMARENLKLGASIENIDEICGALEEGELADLIDEMNIHGWLQARIAVVERRLAYLSSVILADKAENIELLKTAAYETGRRHAAGNDMDAAEGYKLLEDSLVNGMPCDRVNSLTESSEGIVSWVQNTEIHAQYWDIYGTDVSVYYEIRKSLIRGIFEGSGLEFVENMDGSFSIKKNKAN